MKRKEMINLALNKLDVKSQHETFYEDIDNLLAIFEEAGMLPPEYFAQPPHMYRGTDYLGNYVNEWEKEN